MTDEQNEKPGHDKNAPAPTNPAALSDKDLDTVAGGRRTIDYGATNQQGFAPRAGNTFKKP